MNALVPAPAIKTTCPYCGVGCGVKATPDGLGGAAIAGDEGHPANFGKLCSKGSALGETLSLDDRLLHPMRRTASGGYQRIRWDDAFDEIAAGFARISQAHGAEALAFYLSGQLLTEDYYVANKLAKGFLARRMSTRIHGSAWLLPSRATAAPLAAISCRAIMRISTARS